MLFRLTVLARLLLVSTLLASCSFNPLAKRQPASTNALQEESNPVQAEAVPSPTFNLYQEGVGRLRLQGRGDRPLRAVSLSGRDDRAELAFEGTDGQLVRLSGTLVNRTPNAMIIDFTRAGSADASGSVRVKYNSSAIDSLTGNGVLDGQSFAIDFSQNLVQVPIPPAPPEAAKTSPQTTVLSASKPFASPVPSTTASVPSPVQLNAEPNPQPSAAAIELPPDRLVRPDINMSQEGAGLFNSAGQAKALSSASVTGQENGRVDLVLRFADAQQVRFMGSVEQKNTGAMVIRLLNADNAAATGLVTVEYNADNSIQALLGDGTLDTEPFSVQFSR